MNIQSIFRLARNVSKYSSYTPKLGAVIVKAGNPISVGFNKNKTHPTCKYSIHAEMAALRTAGKSNLKGAILFVYRELPDGTPSLARPCDECMQNINNSGIKKIYYSIPEYPYYRVEKVPV